MLRRANKRSASLIKGTEKDNLSKKKITENETTINVGVLGDDDVKDVAERTLEKIVLGSDNGIVEELGTETTNSHELLGRKNLNAPKPAWEDEDDKHMLVKVSRKVSNHKYFKSSATEKEISGEKYSQTLKNQFEKVSGAPSWARLKWEQQDEADDDEENDADVDKLLQSTGDYLATSSALPKGIIQMKRCTDANKESPASGKLKSVEFHPTAQVMLAAGMSQTLSLFQIDGEHNPKIHSLFIDNFPIHTAHFSSDGQKVIMGSRHKSFYYFDMIAGKIINVPWIKAMEEPNMKKFKVSPDGKFLVFLGKYGRIHLLSATSMEYISTMKMNGTVMSAAFSSDVSKMFSIGDDGEVYVWDLTTRECTHRFKDEGNYRGTVVAVSRDSQYIAAGSYSGVVNIYDKACFLSKQPRPIKVVKNLTTPCTSACFNSTSEILALTSDYSEQALKLVHFPSMTAFSNFPECTEPIHVPQCMDFSLNSGYFTVGNNRGSALLYRVKHYNSY